MYIPEQDRARSDQESQGTLKQVDITRHDRVHGIRNISRHDRGAMKFKAHTEKDTSHSHLQDKTRLTRTTLNTQDARRHTQELQYKTQIRHMCVCVFHGVCDTVCVSS